MISERAPYKYRKQDILRFIDEFIAHHGYSPTQREIAAHFDIAVGSVHPVVRRMIDEGLLVGGAYPRTLRISEAAMVHLREQM